MGTEAETTSLDVYTTGTLVSASGVVTGLCMKNQHAVHQNCTFRSWGLPSGTVHDRFGDHRLGHSARAVSDDQRGGLEGGEISHEDQPNNIRGNTSRPVH